MKKGKSVKVGIVVALLVLGVGFAVISTTLNMNGTANLKGNASEFNKSILFVKDGAKAAKIEASIPEKTGAVTVSEDGKTLSFETPILDTVNETATVTYYIENRGPYDAKLGEIKCDVTGTNSEYISVNADINYKGLELVAGTEANPTQTEEASTIEVKLIKSYASDEPASVEITCQLPAEVVNK